MGDESFMRQALEQVYNMEVDFIFKISQAEEALVKGEVPVGTTCLSVNRS